MIKIEFPYRWQIGTFIKHFFRTIKWFFQRGSRGYADCDVWSINYYFLDIIIPMLKQLKEIQHGYPGNITNKEWDEILNTMILGFEAAKRMVENDYLYNDSIENYRQQYQNDEKIFHEGMKLFDEWFFALWD